MRREGSGLSMFQRVTIPSVGVRGLSVEVRRSLRPELVPSIRSPRVRRVRLDLKRMRGAEFRDKDDAVWTDAQQSRGSSPLVRRRKASDRRRSRGRVTDRRICQCTDPSAAGATFAAWTGNRYLPGRCADNCATFISTGRRVARTGSTPYRSRASRGHCSSSWLGRRVGRGERRANGRSRHKPSPH